VKCPNWFASILLCGLAIPAFAQTTQPRIGILLPPGTAPCPLHVNGLTILPAAGTPLTAHYDWDFGDPQSKYNHLNGFNAAHIYDQPGRFTVKLTVTDQAGAIQSAAATIVILPDTRQQLYVSPAGSDANTGRSPDAPLKTLARASRLLHSNTDLLIAAGFIYTLENSAQINGTDILLDRYGEGKDPVLLRNKGHGVSTLGLGPKCNGITIQHITFDSPYPADPTAAAPKIGVSGINAAGRNITVRDCTFLNLDDAINANGSPTGLLVQHCSAPLATGLRGYLVWGQGTDHVYLDNSAANSTREHIVRMSGVKRVLIAENDFTNLDRSKVDKDDYSKGTIECHLGSYIYVTNNKVADGTIRVGPLGSNDEAPTSATDWVVIENNTVSNTSILAYPGSHHIMIRGNTITETQNPAIILSAPANGRSLADFIIQNNTATNNSDAGAFLRLWGTVDGVVLKDNTFIAPHLKYGLHGSAAVNVSDNDLSNFTEISHNTWPADGCFIVGHGDNSLRNAEDWAQMKPVQGDKFTDVPTTQSLHTSPN
jgi:PKD repeat protein